MNILKKYRWAFLIPLVLIFAFAFTIGQKPITFASTAAILYLIGWLFAYQKARWLIIFVLSLVPISLIQILQQISKHFTVYSTMTFFFILITCGILTFVLAKRWQIIEKPTKKSFPIGKILLGFLFIFIASYLSNLIGGFFHTTETTQNQTALDSLSQQIPMIVFGAQVITAGFFEEITYRASIFELIFKKYPIIAYIAAALIFTIMHGPTDIYSWLTYGSMSLVLTSFYAKYRNIYLNMSIHILWNTFGFILAFLIK